MDGSQQSPFSTDRPITRREEDLLGRTAFSNSLASAIKGWKGKDSLVIALYGLWGDGKSSVKNMVLDSLRESKDNCPEIIEFNPWQWSGQEQLADAFFDEIGLALGRADSSKGGKKRVAKWKTYAAYLKAGSFLAKSVPNLLFWILGIVGSFGIGGLFLDVTWMKPILFIISLIAILIAAIAKWGGELAEKIVEILGAKHEAREKSLPEIKDEIKEFLKSLNKPVLVIMDDVDRLTSEEIKLLFQLVKGNADFPNLVYLLLFQRDTVEESLEKIGPISGREFLEKIVQVGFDIPRIERPRLVRVLFAGLNELLEDEKVKKGFNEQRWANIFIPGLSPYFNNLRDVHRFLGTLSFHISLFKETGSFEVNPIDLIAIEVLRVFEPDVYKQLPDAKYELTEHHDLTKSKGTNDQTKIIVEALINKARKETQPQVQVILKQLFPFIEWVFGGLSYGSSFDEEWFIDLRVCHPKVFDRYFHFVIPEGDISQAQIDRILSLARDREKLVAEFRVLNERGLLGVILDRLEAYKQKIELICAHSFVTALFDLGDELPDEPGGFLLINPETHASRIIHWFLKQESDPKKRALILKEAILATTGLFLPIKMISHELKRERQEQYPDSFLLSEEDLPELQRYCVDIIRRAAKSGKLKANKNLLYILYRWRELTSPEEPRDWVKILVESRDGLLCLLTAFLQRSESHGAHDYAPKVTWNIDPKYIEDFIPIDEIVLKVNNLTVENLGEKEELAIQAFHDALDPKQRDMPD